MDGEPEGEPRGLELLVCGRSGIEEGDPGQEPKLKSELELELVGRRGEGGLEIEDIFTAVVVEDEDEEDEEDDEDDDGLAASACGEGFSTNQINP